MPDNLDDDRWFDPDALPRILSRSEARRRGFSDRAIAYRLRTGRWRRVLPRVFLTADTLTEPDRWAAALSFAGYGAALSGAAALRASEVARVREPQRILVLVPPSNRIESTRWVRVRASRRPLVVQNWYGPRRVEVARATADEALMMRRLDDVRTLVARVIQQQHCRLDELGAELEAGPRQGSGHLRRALAEVGWGAQSAPEARAARILRRAGITGFQQNVTITLPDGSRRRVDFYWSELRAVLEIDSYEFHLDRRDWKGTWDRHLDLTTFGLSVIHRPPSALDDEAQFVADIRAWLAGRTSDLRRGLA
jgi:hypothetical protein